jgi:catechol 2,3-dioxygenase-like lactoylglutathione lyase family enzyme
MISQPTIPGIHHVTAIAGDPQRNLDFYATVLGLRLVKLTVNFDDPGTYHFYFGNEEGRPGSLLTFFPWPQARHGVIGAGQVAATTFAIPIGSAEYWRSRLSAHGASVSDAGERFGEAVLGVADPDGLRLELIATRDANPDLAWKDSSVDREHAICGFHSATLAEEGNEQTARLLTETMGFALAGNEANPYRYHVGSGGSGAIVDLLCTPDGRSGRLGTGTVHHIAFRTPDEGQQLHWRRELARLGYNVTPVIDRTYFHSIYYREPGGVLFEIATDPPGFAIDEPKEHLGEQLKLPPQYESQRTTLERVLPPLTLPAARARDAR